MMSTTIRKQGYRTTAQLLTKAALDSDQVSMFVDGVDWQGAAGAIFVVKNPQLAHTLHDEFVARGMMTLGKRVVDRPAKVAPPRCPVHGFIMCEQFDEYPSPSGNTIAVVPNGKYVCYHCNPPHAA